MSFDRPLWLLALPLLVAAFWAVQRAGLSAVSIRQRRVALAMRAVLAGLLVLSLAGFRTGGSGDKVAVVFLVDASDSVGAGGVDRALGFVEQAAEAKRRGDLVAVVAFGRDPRLETGMTERPRFGPLAARPDRGATDLARALRLGAALFPEGTKRRIVVLTDGRETRGDARREAARLARQGIVVEGVTIEPPGGADALIEAFDGPARARRGESYRLGITLQASVAGPAHLTVTRDGAIVYDADLTLKAGRTTIPLVERASTPGIHRYVARLAAASDSVPQNNRASAAVIVEGPPRVLLVEGEPGEATALAAALRAGRIQVDVVGPRDVPDLGELLTYSSTVLVDVAAPDLTSDVVATLKAAVTEAGSGLVTVGGEDSYGLGGYRGSELESILPVDSEIKDPKRRPSVAEALVIDTSGSMGRCHCRGGAMAGGVEQSGINKTDISRAGASRAVRALGADDIVGVLAFNTTSQWVVPLQKLPSDEVVRNGLEGLQAAGGTNIPQALRTAVAELKQTKAKLKHIILFTDGWTNQQELVGIAEEVSRAGITLSVVATGEGTGDVLARMASAGKGRFYAGTNLTDVPQVMMQEAILASRNYVNEGVYRAVVTAETPVTETLTAAPPLLGYVATSAKAAATVSLEIGQDDPLLATWRAGLGTVTSWTSDAKARWSNKWVSWEGYRDFWNRAVRSTFAPAGSGAFVAEARITGDRLHVEVAGDRPLGSDVTAVARLLDPNLRVTEVAMERSGAGSFTASAPVSEEGTYLVGVQVRSGGAPVFRDTVTASLPYSAEYLQVAPDPSLVADLARATRGRASIEPARAFDAKGLRASSARHELWPLLALVAALLLPADIAARRLVVSREDLRRGIAIVRSRLSRRERRRVAREAPSEERMDRLMQAKRGAVRRGASGPPQPPPAPPGPPEPPG